MKRYIKRSQQDGGEFSTPFADMVFGLLFIFFLLTLAMVFQRPDVSAFQEKMDQMLKALETKNQETTEWTKKYAALKQTLQASEREKERNQQRASVVQTENHELRKKIEALALENERLQAALRDFKASHHTLLAQYEAFRKDQAQREVSLKRDLSRLERQYVTLKENYTKLTSKQKRLIAENGLLKTETVTLQGMLKQIKTILRKKGLTEILAEVEKMEEDKRKTEERARKGEELVFADFRLTFEFYPDGEIMNGILSDGGKELQDYPFLSEEDVLSLAKEMNREYEEISVIYTKIEKFQHRPRILLKVHPDTSYGSLQDFLKRIRKAIPVSLVPWDG